MTEEQPREIPDDPNAAYEQGLEEGYERGQKDALESVQPGSDASGGTAIAGSAGADGLDDMADANASYGVDGGGEYETKP